MLSNIKKALYTKIPHQFGK